MTGRQEDREAQEDRTLSSCPTEILSNEMPLNAKRSGAFLIGAGDGLLSRVLSDGVPSAL
jgi:hypothetical protein